VPSRKRLNRLNDRGFVVLWLIDRVEIGHVRIGSVGNTADKFGASSLLRTVYSVPCSIEAWSSSDPGVTEARPASGSSITEARPLGPHAIVRMGGMAVASVLT